MTELKYIADAIPGGYISTSEAARLASCTQTHIGRICRSGEVECLRIGREWFIAKASLEAHLLDLASRKEARAEELRQERQREYREALSQKNTTPPAPLPQSPRAQISRPGFSKAVGFTALALLVAGSAFGFAISGAGIPGDMHSRSSEKSLAAVSTSGAGNALSDAISGIGKFISQSVLKFFGLSSSEKPAVVKTNMQPVPIAVKTNPTIPTAPPKPTIVQQTIASRNVTEQITNYVTLSGVSESLLAERLNQLENKIKSSFNQVLGSPTPYNPPPASGGVSNVISLMNNIDHLDGVILNNPTIIGGSISGTSGIGGSGGLAGSGGDGSLAVWNSGSLSGTTTPTFGYIVATSTATSTFAGGISASSLSIANLVGCDTIDTDANGQLHCGTDQTGSGSGTPGGANNEVQFNNNGSFGGDAGFTYSSSTDLLTITNASTTRLTATYASSTNAFFGSVTIGTLSGILKATAGAIGTALVNLATDITGILPVANGGTGWANIFAGAIPYGNGTNALSTTTAGTNGQVLALVGGVPTWTATSTLATITGTLGVSQGGTGLTSTPSFGQLLVGNGSGYTLSATSTLAIALSDTTGTLPTTRGGTNITSYTTGDTLYASATNVLSKLAIGTGGQVLAVVGGIPSWVATTTLATISGTLGVANGGTATTTWMNGAVAFYDSTLGTLSQAATQAAFFFDKTNSRLGIGTSSPFAKLAVQATAGQSNAVFEVASSSYATKFLTVDSAGVVTAPNASTTNLTYSGYLGGLARVGNSSYWTSQDAFNASQSAGLQSGGTITDNGNGTAAVAAGTGYIKAVDSDVANVMFFDFAASSTVGFPSATSTRYIGVEYNAGSPRVVAKSTDTWDLDTEFPLGVASRETNTVHIVSLPWQTADTMTNVIERLDSRTCVRDERLGGLILGETGTRNITVSSGSFLCRVSEFPQAAINTSGSDTFRQYYRDGSGGWVMQTAQTQWNNTQYDSNAGTLTTLSNNDYTSRWFYLESDHNLVMLFGQSQSNNLATILAEGPPSSVPDSVQRGGILIGRLIIQKSATTASTVQSAFGTAFSASTVTSHADLANLLWTSSGHTGTANTFPYFSGSGAALEAATSTIFGTGTGGQVLSWLGGIPTWTATTTLATITGTLGTTQGGTNITSYTTGDTLYASATNVLSKLAIGTGGQVLAVVSGIPQWVATTTLATISGSLDLANQVGSSLLAVANGGTGWANISANSVLLGNGTGRVATTSAGTNGQALALVGGVPTWVSTTTAGTGLTYTGTAFNVNSTQSISTLSNLTTNGVVYTSGGTGALNTLSTFFFNGNTQSLGIGTSTPQFSLQIASSTGPQLALSDGSQSNNPWTFRSINGYLYIATSSAATFATSTITSALAIDTNGNVGIGTSSPQYRLHIWVATSTTSASPTDVATLEVSGPGSGSGTVGAGPSLLFKDAAVGAVNYMARIAAVYEAARTAAGGTGKVSGLAFYTSGSQVGPNNTLEEVSRISSYGQLGVGTTTPWATLAVNPTAANTPTNEFVVGSSTATHFIITNTGNVGIGTTSPILPLSIGANGSFGGFQYSVGLSSITTGGPGIFFTGNTGYDGRNWSLSANGSGNTNIGGAGTFALTDRTAGLARLVVDASGNIGIGTTTPGAKLDVEGTIAASDGTASGGVLALGRSINSVLSATSGTLLTINGAAYTNVNIANGSVGIGTTSPSSLFSINGVANFGAATTTFSSTGGIDLKSGGCFAINGTCVGGSSFSNTIASGGTATTTFYNGGVVFYNSTLGTLSQASAQSGFSYSNTTGNVGIGSTSPTTALLTVQKDQATGTLITVENDNTAGFASLYLNGTFGGTTGGSLQWNNTSGLENLFLYTAGAKNLNFGIGGQVKMTLNGTTGYFGIGTTTPSGQFAVSTSSASEVKQIVLQNTSSGGESIELQQSTGATGGKFLWDNNNSNAWLYSGASSNLIFGTGGQTERARITSAGNFGIGTTTPSARLDIAGSLGSQTTLFNISSTTATNVISSLFNVNANGNVGVGTTTPWRMLSVTGTVANPQQVIAYDTTRYATFQTDSVGDLAIEAQGQDIRMNDDNLWLCSGGSCPSGNPSGTGSLIAETGIGVASSTPWAGLSLASGKAILVAENTLATSTSMTVDWRNGNQQLVRIGTSATTITFTGYVEGQKLVLSVCNPATGSGGAITWATQILWPGGTAPTQTTTATKCDIWSFLATNATSSLKIFGSQNANF